MPTMDEDREKDHTHLEPLDEGGGNGNAQLEKLNEGCTIKCTLTTLSYTLNHLMRMEGRHMLTFIHFVEDAGEEHAHLYPFC